jgi:hypothetical protein
MHTTNQEDLAHFTERLSSPDLDVVNQAIEVLRVV